MSLRANATHGNKTSCRRTKLGVNRERGEEMEGTVDPSGKNQMK